MRKSTLVVMAILIVALVGLTLVMKMYTDQFIEEIGHAKELTKEFRDEQHLLAPDSTVRLARVMGSSQTLVHDPASPGLLLEASPTPDAWKSDKAGRGIATQMALRLFEVYLSDRPIFWIQFRLARPDGTVLPEFALARGDGGAVVPVESESPTKTGTPAKSDKPVSPGSPGNPEKGAK
jgi:hypothetical protein